MDYALRTDDLDAEVIVLQERGLTVEGPYPGGRFRPDGQRVDWRIIRFGGNDQSPALPFYCFDDTDRSLRVPGGEASTHANGVTGVAGVTVVVQDLTRAIPQFAALTGDEGAPFDWKNDPLAGGHQFPVGAGWLRVVQPDTTDSDLRRHLDAHGESIYAVRLRASAAGIRDLPRDEVHGARLSLETVNQAESAAHTPS